MMARAIFKQAQENKYAIGSFNFSSAEILKANILAAQSLNAPIIVSTSENEGDFVGFEQAVALVGAWKKKFQDSPILLNLDHGKSLEVIKEAVSVGYDLVHFDGSYLSYEANLAMTKEIVDYVKSQNSDILVEGELGYLRGSSALHEELLEIKEADLTLPDQAADFVRQTGIDSLAVVIGNAHGVFTKSPEKLYLNRLKEVREAVEDDVFLVLHGGSGVPDEDVQEAIKIGITKVNVNTELRVAYRDALRDFIAAHPQETTPYKILGPASEAVQKVVEGKIKIFM